MPCSILYAISCIESRYNETRPYYLPGTAPAAGDGLTVGLTVASASTSVGRKSAAAVYAGYAVVQVPRTGPVCAADLRGPVDRGAVVVGAPLAVAAQRAQFAG